MGTGFHRKAYVDGTVVIRRIRGTQADANIVTYLHRFVIDEEFQLLTRYKFAEPKVLDGEFVFAIGGKAMADRHSAARTERQAFQTLVLRSISRCNIGHFRRRLPKTDRGAGDSGRRRHVCLEKGGRYR